MSLAQKIVDHAARVGVIGLGYVGLPLAVTAARAGYPVTGFDVDAGKMIRLDAGSSYIEAVSDADLAAVAGGFDWTTDFSRLSGCDVIVICVPTPLTRHREPDLSYVEQTARTIAAHMTPDTLVILESTTFPGTTDLILRPILAESGLEAGRDFFLGFSPEREDPGNTRYRTKSIPKVVSGDGEAAGDLVERFYANVVEEVVRVSSTSVAEAVKITENIFRSVNIALVNELKVVFHAMGIDVHEVLDAAATKPFGFMKFTPGPGLGGHCIPIDPFYLTWKARQYEQNTRFIELAGEVNTDMPRYVLRRTIEALNAHKKSVNGSRILLVGLAYKPDVDDDRESPTYKLMDFYKEMGAEVSYYDPFVPVIKPSREHGHWAGTASVAWDRDTISGFDAVVISTNHSEVDYDQLAVWTECVIDTRNAMNGREGIREGQVWKS